MVETEDYNSENTMRMTVDQIEEILLERSEIISELENRGGM